MLSVALLFAVQLAQVDPTLSGPESCGDLDPLANAATTGVGCAGIERIQSCLERLAANAVPEDLPQKWLLANGRVVTLAQVQGDIAADGGGDAGIDPNDGGLGPSLPIDAESCAGYGDQRAVGGLWRDVLLSECLHLVSEAGGRAELRRAIEAQLARAERLDHTCSAAAASAAAESAKSDAAEEADAITALEKAHPEVAPQAISAVLCRTEAYRKWVRGQIKVAEHVGGLDNIVGAHQLRQLQAFLESKEAEATRVLFDKFHAKPLSCDKAPVRTLWHCVAPPTLVNADGETYVEDPAEDCQPPAHFDRYLPETGWHLGPAWFQPTHWQ